MCVCFFRGQCVKVQDTLWYVLGEPKVSTEKSERVLLRISHAHVPRTPSPLCVTTRGLVGGGGYRLGLPLGLFRHNPRPQCPTVCHNLLHLIDFIVLD